MNAWQWAAAGAATFGALCLFVVGAALAIVGREDRRDAAFDAELAAVLDEDSTS